MASSQVIAEQEELRTVSKNSRSRLLRQNCSERTALRERQCSARLVQRVLRGVITTGDEAKKKVRAVKRRREGMVGPVPGECWLLRYRCLPLIFAWS